MGHNPPPPAPTALQRLRDAYANDRITLTVYTDRVDYLIRNGLEARRDPMPWDDIGFFCAPEGLDRPWR